MIYLFIKAFDKLLFFNSLNLNLIINLGNVPHVEASFEMNKLLK
jgi:hypothetical protein